MPGGLLETAYVEILPELSAFEGEAKAGIAQAMVNAQASVTKATSNITASFEKSASSASSAYSTAGDEAATAIADTMASAADAIDASFAASSDGIAASLGAVADSAALSFDAAAVGISGSLDAAAADASSAFDGAASSIGDSLGGAADNAGAALSDGIGGAVDDAVKTVGFGGITEAATVAGIETGNELAVGIEAGARKGAAESAGSIRGLAKIIPGLAVFTGAIEGLKALKDGVSEAADAQIVAARNAGIFGKGLELVDEAAKKSTTTTSLQFEKAATQFGLVLQKAGVNGKQLGSQTDELVQRAADLAAKFNIPFDQAATAVSKGLTGATRGLKPFIGAISSTDIAAEGMRIGLVKAAVSAQDVATAQGKVKIATDALTAARDKYGKGSDQVLRAEAGLRSAEAARAKAQAGIIPKLTTEQTVLAARSLILRKTADSSDFAAKHSKSLVVQEKELGAVFGNLKENIGKQLIPALSSAAHLILNVTKFVGRNKAEFKLLLDVLVPLGAAFVAYKVTAGAVALIEKAATVARTAYAAVTGLFTAETVAATGATEAQAVAQEGLDAAFTANPIGAVVAALTVLVVGLVEAYKHSATFRAILDTMGRVLKATFNWVKDHWKLLGVILLAPIAPILAVVAVAIHFRGKIISVFDDVKKAVVSFAKAVGNGVATAAHFIASLPGRAASALSSFGSTIWGVVRAAFGILKSVIHTGIRLSLLPIEVQIKILKKVWDLAWGGIALVVSSAWDIVKPIFDTILSYVGKITGGVSKILGAISKVTHFGGKLNPLNHLAAGGLVLGPTRALIGEAGPELVLPLTNARRTVELMHKSGLLQLVAPQLPALQVASTQAVAGRGTIPTTPRATRSTEVYAPITLVVPTEDPVVLATQLTSRFAAWAER